MIVWDVDCENAGSWRAGRRYCRKKGDWVSKEECYACAMNG